jgi:riboflavin kinase / FMN adenylyltransferase
MPKRSPEPFRLWSPARLADGSPAVPAPRARRAVAIGNFDGAHLGHAALAARAREAGAGEVIALTFSPHPARFFRPEVPHFRLMPEGLRAAWLADAGFDGALVLPFDAALANMSAADFVTGILLGALKADLVVVGEDFHFGKGRAGTPDFLRAEGARLGFAVLLVPPVKTEAGDVMSSSAIRMALAAGDLPRANAMLGRAFAILGTVIHGAKRGRELGYPTANIALEEGFGLRHGVYAVRVLLEGREYAGAASFGTRPQFDNGPPLLEVHLLDFSGDLYGKALEVRFAAYLRPEGKFASLEALIVQMEADCKKARELLAERAGA